MNTKVNFCGVEFENPVVTGSGTFGFGYEYSQYYDLDAIGGISVKGLTLKPREGNKPPRIAEVYGGILNSVGLQNPGLENFLNNDLPFLKKKFSKCKIIANIAGNTLEDYIEMGRLISQSNVDIVEMNISCPNVKHGGVAFGTDPCMVSEITYKVKEQCNKPLVVKLSPNVTDIVAIAKAAESAGADGLSLINTLLGMKIDINTRRPILNNNVGGMSGPAVKPVAVRMVWQVANAVNIPIIGMGGIQDGDDAVEFMLAGASLVSVGTQNFVDPYAAVKTANGIEEYMTKHGIEDVNELIGAVKPW
ncbi:MAG: dihydroorotate dehydrogenase [Clostridia bacterium]|nr:dihydroorotate dehydrogenase [Clostridia bacterium]